MRLILWMIAIVFPLWANASVNGVLSVPYANSEAPSKYFKISVDSTQPVLFLKKSISPSASTYAIEAMGLIPLTLQPCYIPFLVLHTRFNHEQAQFLSIGGGCRYLVGDERVFGGYLFLDQVYSKYGPFYILSPRFEWMTPHVSLWFNAYLPFCSTQSFARPVRSLSRNEVEYLHQPEHHALYALYHKKTATLGPSLEWMVGKQLNQFQCYGGVYMQYTSALDIGVLMEVSYAINHMTDATVSLAHNLSQASTQLSLSIKFQLAAHVPRQGSVQSRFYAPIERYRFYSTATEPLSVQYAQEAKKTTQLIDAYAWIPNPGEFNQALIHSADSKATFYLVNQNHERKRLRYGRFDESIHLKAGQSIIGVDARLRPLSTNFIIFNELSEMNHEIPKLPLIKSALILPGQNNLYGVELKNTLELKNNNIDGRGIVLEHFLKVDAGFRTAIHVGAGSNISLDNIILVLKTESNDHNSQAGLTGSHSPIIKDTRAITVENSSNIYISRMIAHVSGVNRQGSSGTLYHYGSIYGIFVKNSTLSMQDSAINVTAEASCESDICPTGELIGIRAEHRARVDASKTDLINLFDSEHLKYQSTSYDSSSQVTVNNKE